MTALPDGWQLRPFSACFSVLSDSGLRLAQRDYASAGRFPVVDQGAGLVGGFTDEVDLLQKNPLPVLVFGDHTRRVKYVDFPFVVGAQGVKLLRPAPDVDTRFAHWMLESVELADRGYGRHFALLRKREFVVPPIVEQRRIVELLDDHFSRLDAAEAYLSASASRLSIMRITQLRQLRRELEQSGTPMQKLGAVAQTSLGKMLDAKRAVGEPTQYLRNINVRWGSFDLSDVKSVPLRDAEREFLALRSGDLLVCEGGEPGRCAVWQGADQLMTFQKALHRVRVDANHLLPDFVAAMIEVVIAGPEAEQMFTGTTIKHLPQERLRQIELPIPAIEEQVQATAALAETRAHVERLSRSIESARIRSKALRRGLLDAAFTGQLDRMPLVTPTSPGEKPLPAPTSGALELPWSQFKDKDVPTRV